MNRRSFLKRMAIAPVAAYLGVNVIKEEKVIEPRGFGLVPIKREGATIRFDVSGDGGKDWEHYSLGVNLDETSPQDRDRLLRQLGRSMDITINQLVDNGRI